MKICKIIELGAVRRNDNLVDLEKRCKMSIWLQKSASIQPRTSPLKFVGSRDSCTPSPVVRPSTEAPSREAPSICAFSAAPRQVHRALWLHAGVCAGCSKIGKIKICKFLASSFSAVSKRNFARKYAFDSIFQDLQDLHPFAPSESNRKSMKSAAGKGPPDMTHSAPKKKLSSRTSSA